jgi:hypothetical protein
LVVSTELRLKWPCCFTIKSVVQIVHDDGADLDWDAWLALRAERSVGVGCVFWFGWC